MKKTFSRLFLLLSLGFLAVSSLPAQGNPFTGTSPAAEPSRLPSVIPIPEWMRDMQRELHTQLAALLRASQTDAGAFFLLLLTALLYGIFHSLLPGHQKTLVTAFYLSHDAKPRSALATAGLFTVLHMVSSMGIYGVVLLITHFSGGGLGYGATSDIAGQWTQFIAALGAIGLAVYLLWETWGDIRALRGGNHLHHHHHGHGHDHSDHSPHQLKKNYWWMLAVAGLMPCPGTLLVLFFAFSLGAHFFGIMAAAAIGVGVGLVLGLIAFASIMARRTGGKLVSGRRAEVIAVVFQILAALLILLTSIFLLL